MNIATDLEGFIDLISEKAGKPLLMDVNYDIVSAKGNTLTIEVTGDASMDEEEEEEAENA